EAPVRGTATGARRDRSAPPRGVAPDVRPGRYAPLGPRPPRPDDGAVDRDPRSARRPRPRSVDGFPSHDPGWRGSGGRAGRARRRGREAKGPADEGRIAPPVVETRIRAGSAGAPLAGLGGGGEAHPLPAGRGGGAPLRWRTHRAGC